MSTTELKKKLIGKITGTENENLLLEVYRLLEIEDEEVAIYPLTGEQISAVHESQQQIKDGKFLNDRDANKEIDEWRGDEKNKQQTEQKISDTQTQLGVQ